jgi:hypothetical protein
VSRLVAIAEAHAVEAPADVRPLEDADQPVREAPLLDAVEVRDAGRDLEAVGVGLPAEGQAETMVRIVGRELGEADLRG